MTFNDYPAREYTASVWRWKWRASQRDEDIVWSAWKQVGVHKRTGRGVASSVEHIVTYQGTWITLVRNLGFSEAEAKAIEANYHELYKVSDQYVQDRLDRAAQDGYVEVAFGLRLRTPLLHQCMRNSKYTPYEADAEGRTAGNALGQSYGLLNNRAFNEFMGKVWKSKYRNDIKPVALIHDAIYLLLRDNVEVVEWVNRELIASMSWQELPELQHDTVKIGAELDLFWPSWANAIGLKPGASQEDILKKCREAVEKQREKTT